MFPLLARKSLQHAYLEHPEAHHALIGVTQRQIAIFPLPFLLNLAKDAFLLLSAQVTGASLKYMNQ